MDEDGISDGDRSLSDGQIAGTVSPREKHIRTVPLEIGQGVETEGKKGIDFSPQPPLDLGVQQMFKGSKEIDSHLR